MTKYRMAFKVENDNQKDILVCAVHKDMLKPS